MLNKLKQEIEQGVQIISPEEIENVIKALKETRLSTFLCNFILENESPHEFDENKFCFPLDSLLNYYTMIANSSDQGLLYGIGVSDLFKIVNFNFNLVVEENKTCFVANKEIFTQLVQNLKTTRQEVVSKCEEINMLLNTASTHAMQGKVFEQESNISYLLSSFNEIRFSLQRELLELCKLHWYYFHN